MNETLYTFVFGNGINVSATEKETLEQQTYGQHNDFEKFVDSGSQNQLLEKTTDDKIKTAADNVVLTVENRMRDALLTAMDKKIIPRAERPVKSITGSSRHGPKSEVQNLDRKDLIGISGNTPLMSASSRLDLNRTNETRIEEKFEDGDFPALRPSYDRRAQTNHNWSCPIAKN